MGKLTVEQKVREQDADKKPQMNVKRRWGVNNCAGQLFELMD